MSLQQYFAKYISGETEQIEALCALFSERIFLRITTIMSNNRKTNLLVRHI